MSQKTLIFSYFRSRPNKTIRHAEVVDWATKEYKIKTGKVFRDPDRAIRNLYQEGLLVKESKGAYKYNPDSSHQKKLEDFNQNQKQKILKRDGYRCVICGLGKREGLELHVDHIKPKDRGGKADIDNGQTLCSIHNFRKKNYSQTESGKRMFIRLMKQAKKINDVKAQEFSKSILQVYDKYDINGHIEWEEEND